MQIAVQHHPSTQSDACLVVACHEGKALSASALEIDRQSQGALSALFELGDYTGDTGQCQLLYNLPGVNAERVLLVGLGKAEKTTDRAWKKVATAIGKTLAHSDIPAATLALFDLPIAHRSRTDLAEILVQGILDAQYRFDVHKMPAPRARRGLAVLTLQLPADTEATERAAIAAAAEKAEITQRAVTWAKDLANQPGNICTPTWLADQATAMAERLGLHSKILGPAEMDELGMHLLLGVAQGSRQEPRLIVLEYRGGTADQAPIVLVGKGLTFDAGGISLKPADKMDEMKYDMCGGASALAAIQAAAELKLPLNVVTIVPASENLPDGQATKPGDVHKGMAGISVEIINTDAEGRLILADALTYAKRYDPEVVIDMATLTGACVIALGHQTAAVLGNQEALIDELLKAGRQSLDRAWQLPLYEEYQEQLKSPVADLSNVGGRPAGTITAAGFLSRFAEDYPWAHLDIAGVAWTSGEHKGATGRPVPLLVQFLRNRAGHG